MVLLLLACKADPTESPPEPVDWSASRPRLADEVPAPAGWGWARTIAHLHSPYSHDACDGEGLVDGVFNEACLSDLRAGLCALSIDVAFVTDHPAHMRDQPYADLLLAREGDSPGPTWNTLACGTTIMPGYEDELMPLGLEEQVEEADYDAYDDLTVSQLAGGGADVFIAHTEGRDALPGGIAGVEIYNLHAMFDPDIRADDLGLDPLAWTADIGSFIEGDAVPDLFFLSVHQAQPPSLAIFDANPTFAGIGGTDAHQNVFPAAADDGERVDSYRRMLSWFSNWLIVKDGEPSSAKEAIAAGRSFLVFEVLGTPDTLDFWLDNGGERVEMGQVGAPGTLHLPCPALSPSSPTNLEEPEVTVRLLKDGVVVHEGCGTFEATPGAWRVEIEIVPWHLRDFLGPLAEQMVHAYPWVYSNRIRVE